MFPIKYIENNLVFNHDGECFAYYELTPYNYSFLSPEEKYMVHDNFRQLIAQNRDGKIHALQIATEDSLRAVQERSKKGITGRLKEIACKKVDEQTEALVSMIGDNQVDYRFFLGFKLLVNEEEISLKGMKKSAAMSFTDFIYEVNHKLMGDFVSMSNDEINRFMKMEKLLEDGINAIGLGPQGMGGHYSVMGVNIENTARHPSAIGVAVNVGCWSHRRGHIVFDKDLNFTVDTHTGFEYKEEN